MEGYRVKVVQTIDNDEGEPLRRDFVQYVSSMRLVRGIVSRFETPEPGRMVLSISIKLITFQVEGQLER